MPSMPETSACTLCGLSIRWVEVGGERIALDTIPNFDGRYRLVGESQARAERIDRPGFQGYQDHAETCPKRN
jgi:hypothetical protein